MITNRHRCVRKTLHIFTNNIAVVFSFQKRRSHYRLARTIIRASYLVAGDLACKLFVYWTHRRAEVESIVTDDLTIMDFSTSSGPTHLQEHPVLPSPHHSMDEKPLI